MDKLTFLGHDNRVASLIILYFVVPGISIPKIRSHKNGHRDILVTIMELLCFLNHTYLLQESHAKFENNRTILTCPWTDPKYRKAYLKKKITLKHKILNSI